MFNLQMDEAVLAPLIERIVVEVLGKLEAKREQLGQKLAYSEEEAARLLGLERHVLADERRRGRIHASQIVGRRIRYTKQDLTTYLAQREWTPN